MKRKTMAEEQQELSAAFRALGRSLRAEFERLAGKIIAKIGGQSGQ